MNRTQNRGHINQFQSNNERFSWTRNVFRKQWGSGHQWKWTGWEPRAKTENWELRNKRRETRTENWEIAEDNAEEMVRIMGCVLLAQSMPAKQVLWMIWCFHLSPRFPPRILFDFLLGNHKPETKPQQTAQRREWKIPDNSWDWDFTFRSLGRRIGTVDDRSGHMYTQYAVSDVIYEDPHRISGPPLSWPRICVRNAEKCFNKLSQVAGCRLLDGRSSLIFSF